MHSEQRRGQFVISTDPARLDIDVIHGFLTECYWAQGIPRQTVVRSIEGSFCFGVYDGARQVGFARVITGRATFAYLADVFILESHRGAALGKWLVETIVGHPELRGLRRWHLVTRDAHSLYEQFGFTALQEPSRHMEIFCGDIYERAEGERPSSGPPRPATSPLIMDQIMDQSDRFYAARKVSRTSCYSSLTKITPGGKSSHPRHPGMSSGPRTSGWTC